MPFSQKAGISDGIILLRRGAFEFSIVIGHVGFLYSGSDCHSSCNSNQVLYYYTHFNTLHRLLGRYGEASCHKDRRSFQCQHRGTSVAYRTVFRVEGFAFYWLTSQSCFCLLDLERKNREMSVGMTVYNCYNVISELNEIFKKMKRMSFINDKKKINHCAMREIRHFWDVLLLKHNQLTEGKLSKIYCLLKNSVRIPHQARTVRLFSP